MKTFTYRWSKQTTLLILTLIGLVLMTFFNACKKSAEKTSEVLIEKSIGSDADVDIAAAVDDADVAGAPDAHHIAPLGIGLKSLVSASPLHWWWYLSPRHCYH